MKRILTLLAIMLGATPALALNSSSHALLRGLDKITDEVVDISVPVGSHAKVGPLTIEVHDCRYPAGNPAGEAYAYLVVRDEMAEAPVFRGWMIASSPALNAMEHRRYDVWVLRCTNG